MADNPVALLQRIADLQRERDELHLDIEQLCMQQSGMSSKADVVSQIQARSIATLKKDLEASKAKLDDYMKRNDKLEDELTEVYRIKSQFADLLQKETDKNVELEKNIKFFQTTVATALGERDRAILEADTSQGREKELLSKINQLEKRMELLLLEIHNHQKVIDFFWVIRNKESELGYIEGYDKKAAVLLGDSHNSWTYGDREKELEILHGHIREGEIAMASLQKKYQASAVLVSNLTSELDKVARLKKLAEDRFVEHKEKMACSVIMLAEKIKKIQAEQFRFRKEIMEALEDAAEWRKLFAQSFQLKFQTRHNMNQATNDIFTTPPFIEREVFHSDFATGTDENNKISAAKDSEMQILDMKEALALALQEKVAALLILAKQEERRILEENTIAAQEHRIAELQMQLIQATADKAKTLMQLSNICRELKEIHDQQCEGNHPGISDDHSFHSVWDSAVEKGSSKSFGNIQEESNVGGSSSPRWVWSKASIAESMKEQAQRQSKDTRDVSRYWFPKYWLKDEVHKSTDHISSGIRPGNDTNVSRLQAENSALWGIMTILQQLCNAVMRMHRKISEAAKGAWNENAGSGISMLDSVIAEGNKLRLSFSNLDSTNEPVKKGTDDMRTWFLNAAKTKEVNIAAPFGGPLLDSILLAAEICKMCLASHTQSCSKPLTSSLEATSKEI